jgi:hypothetical protein
LRQLQIKEIAIKRGMRALPQIPTAKTGRRRTTLEAVVQGSEA